jgi:epoxyqueuosine reductase
MPGLSQKRENTVNNLETIVRATAREQGFAMVGFARLKRLDSRDQFFRQWIDDGRPGEMGWLAREPEKRFDPRMLDPRLRSVISLGFPYDAPAPPPLEWKSQLRGRIAAYALGPDYHVTVLARAREVAKAIESACPGSVTRAYVDTGPVFEREWAAEGRLGWFGRNTNLLNQYHGSYFFLAEIFTDLDFPSAPEPYRDHCGTCRQCLDLCPTQALAEGYLLEPRLCISYLTIEHRGPIPPDLRPKLGNWIFGCDICQEVCPWNSDAARAAASEDLAPDLAQLMMLDAEGFRRRYGKTAVSRTKRRGLLRNAAVALGNSGNGDAVAILIRTMEAEPEPIVRGHAAWALGRLGGRLARAALERARSREEEASVKVETDNALSGLLS